MKALVFGIITLCAIVDLFLSPCHAEPTAAQSPRLLVHLLDYLARDYSGAVARGQVVSQSEYEEQREFSKTTVSIADGLPDSPELPAIKAGLKELHSLVERKDEAEKVSRLARDLKLQVIGAAGLVVFPREWPSLARGRRLFAQQCISCHGATGQGDGPLASSLSPRPPNFLDSERMNGISPLHAYNTIRLGVPGTGMPAFISVSDIDAWDLAYYVLSLRHVDVGRSAGARITESADTLSKISTRSDSELASDFSQQEIGAFRGHSRDGSVSDSLEHSRDLLKGAGDAYARGDLEQAKWQALRAYLEGIEPIEPRLRASAPELIGELESAMAEIRGAIESRHSLSIVQEKLINAEREIAAAEMALQGTPLSPYMIFLGASGILLREGFEAVLIIIALLSVIRVTGDKRAAGYVHLGWISALLAGTALWNLSGELLMLSGAGRETMEGVTSLIAVGILLVVGFWLHSQTEIGRWKSCIEGRVRNALKGKNLLGLAGISFLAVFREAFETVLFLRTVWLEGGDAEKTAMAAGVLSSLVLVIGLASLVLRYSVKIPVRQLFNASAVILGALSVILVGKGVHAFQEVGSVTITTAPLMFRSNLLGLYPTYETCFSQIVVFSLVIALGHYGKKPAHRST